MGPSCRAGRRRHRKVHLVVDRDAAHRPKTVRTWLAEHEDQIQLHSLSSYSPELNRDEMTNAGLKRRTAQQTQKPGRTRHRNPPVLPPPTTQTTHSARIPRRLTRPLHPQRVNPMSF
ncbi:transposase [Streptomyces sp. NPDC101219]|uniref:transposase n=1 Tax=Streptomyces sp. NPDC101219 TaxID=3366131 RepID=UPI003824E1F4